MRGWKLVLALVVAVGMAACSADGPLGGGRVSTVTMRFLTPATVKSLIVEVTGPGIDPAVVMNIEVGADTVATGSLTLPSGSARRFVVTAVDTAGVQTHRADTTITLQAGANPSLAMRLEPLPSTLGITVTFGGIRMLVTDTSTIALGVGASATTLALALRASGDTVPPDSLSWGTSNPAIATVIGGVVTGVRTGEAVVSVSYQGAVALRRVLVGTNTSPVEAPLGASSVFLFQGALSNAVNVALGGSGSALTFTANRFGVTSSAILFSGVNEAELPAGVIDDLPSGTLALWIRQDAGTGYSNVLTKNCASVECDASRVFFLTINGCADGNGLPTSGATGQLCWQSGNYVVSPANFPFSAPLTPGTWSHVAITWGDGQLSLYRDGALDRTVESCSGCFIRSNPSYPIRLGLGFAGALDDLVVYPRALSVQEVFDLSRVVR